MVLPTTVEDTALMLGQTLRQRRKALGIPMTAAAETARISRVTWHRLEKGEPTVALGLLLAAAQVLGLRVKIEDGRAIEAPAPPASGDWLPLRIRLSDYPALRALAWQVGNDAATFTPREAFGLYQRNWRHVDADALQESEVALIRALKTLFDGQRPDV